MTLEDGDLPPKLPTDLLGAEGPPPTTPKSAIDTNEANVWSGTEPAKTKDTYERPDQPLGRTPRNPLESIKNFGLGIAEGTHQLVKMGVDLAANKHEKDPQTGEYKAKGARDEWLDEWGRISRNPKARQEGELHIAKETWRNLVDPMLDDNGNVSIRHALWEDPAGFANTAFVVRDLIAGLAKTSGRLAGGVSRAAMSAQEAASLGKIGTADKLVNLGERLGKVNPITGTVGKLADLTVKHTPLGDILGIGPETKDVSAIIGNIKAQEDIAAYDRALSLAKHRLSPAEADQVANMIDLGRAQDWQTASPAARDYVAAYDSKLRTPSEVELTERGFLKPEQKLLARAQQASQRLYGNMDKANVADALARIKSGELNPMYRHLATKKGDWYDMLDKLIKEAGGAQGTVGFLEHRVGGGDYIKDPIEAAMVQNDMYRQFNTKKRIVDEVVAHLQQKGLANAIATEKDLKRGQSIVPVDFWKKYLEVGQRAGGVAIAEKLAGADNAAAASKALETVLKDRKMLAAIDNAKDVALPSHVARHLALELGIPGYAGRVYDKMFRYWKQAVTVLRPNYWLNVAAGNGILAAIHGVRLDDAFRSYKLKDLLPAELRTSVQTVLRPGQGPIARRYNVVANTLGQLDSALHHTMVHAPIFATEVESSRRAAMEAMQNLHKSGQSFFLAQDIVNDPQKWFQIVSAAPGDYSKALGNKVILQEQIAKSIPEIMAKQREYNVAAKELSKFQKAIVGGQPTQAQFLKLNDLEMAERQLNHQLLGMKSDALDAAAKTGAIKEQIPQIERIRRIAEDAIEPLNNFGGDYNRMHPLEKAWFRRAVPFYAWSKAMTKLVASLPYTYPTKTFLWNRWSQMMATAQGEEHHPAWLQAAIPIWDCEDGDTIYMRPFWNPIERTTTTRLGDVEMPNLFDVWSGHPLIKVGMDLKGGVDQYTMKPFNAPINGVRRDDGETYLLDPSGKAEKIIAQPPLLRSLYHLFPYSQYIDALLLEQKQRRNGWLGDPDPARGPNGEVMPPTNLFQRLRDTFTPFRTTNYDRADAIEKKNQAGVIKDYVDAIKKEADPERREKMMTILNDYIAQYRKRN